MWCVVLRWSDMVRLQMILFILLRLTDTDFFTEHCWLRTCFEGHFSSQALHCSQSPWRASCRCFFQVCVYFSIFETWTFTTKLHHTGIYSLRTSINTCPALSFFFNYSAPRENKLNWITQKVKGVLCSLPNVWQEYKTSHTAQHPCLQMWIHHEEPCFVYFKYVCCFSLLQHVQNGSMKSSLKGRFYQTSTHQKHNIGSATHIQYNTIQINE